MLILSRLVKASRSLFNSRATRRRGRRRPNGALPAPTGHPPASARPLRSSALAQRARPLRSLAAHAGQESEGPAADALHECTGNLASPTRTQCVTRSRDLRTLGTPARPSAFGAPGRLAHGTPARHKAHGTPGSLTDIGAPGRLTIGTPARHTAHGTPGRHTGLGAPGRSTHGTPARPSALGSGPTHSDNVALDAGRRAPIPTTAQV